MPSYLPLANFFVPALRLPHMLLTYWYVSRRQLHPWPLPEPGNNSLEATRGRFHIISNNCVPGTRPGSLASPGVIALLPIWITATNVHPADARPAPFHIDSRQSIPGRLVTFHRPPKR